MRLSLAALVLVTACAREARRPDPQPPEVTTSEPDAASAPATGCAGPPPGPGYECVRDCGEPVSRADDPEPGWSWLTAEQAENRRNYGCPICLPHDARIAAPGGDVAIARLQPG